MRRLGNTERCAAIIDAALPLFARKGFTATTTKEIAQAAGVSEALIFKHFPSKAALYEAIFRSCVDGDEELAGILAMEPDTAAVIAYVRAVVRHYVRDVPGDPDNLLPRHRLLADGNAGRDAGHRAPAGAPRDPVAARPGRGRPPDGLLHPARPWPERRGNRLPHPDRSTHPRTGSRTGPPIAKRRIILSERGRS